MIMTALHGWYTKKIDYVLAYPQAPLEREIYMHIPKGFKVVDEGTKDYVLKLQQYIYGQKQTGILWNH